jgi:hypothetical protein
MRDAKVGDMTLREGRHVVSIVNPHFDTAILVTHCYVVGVWRPRQALHARLWDRKRAFEETSGKLPDPTHAGCARSGKPLAIIRHS